MLNDAFGEGLQNRRVITQVVGFYELDVGVLCRDLIGEPINTVNQNARKQKVWRNDDPFVAKFGSMGQARLDQRERHAGITNF